MISARNLCIVFLLLCSQAMAVIGDEDSAQLTEFDNGLRLLVLPRPDQSLARVDVYLSLRGAARNGGLAHFVEHLMFRSTKESPAGSLCDSLELLSIKKNASTSPRHITTSTSCLPDLLPRLLKLEAERFGELQPDELDVAYEKNRVLGEQDFRYETKPYMGLVLRTVAMAYEEEGEGDPLIGNPEMIQAMNLAAAEEFIARWFRSDRMVVLVSGPVDPEEVVGLTKATFGAIPAPVEELVISELPRRPEPRSFITSSNIDWDMLIVGFRLPYSTAEEAAVVHLTETIMDRENGKPVLSVFDDEAFLAVSLFGEWSEGRTDEQAAEMALDQFWAELKKVKRRVRNNWLFERNRLARVKNLSVRMNQPFRLANWRAQGLADDREVPEPLIMAAMVDSMDQETIEVFFDEQFTKSRSFIAFAAGRAPENDSVMSWNDSNEQDINPYFSHSAEPGELGTLGYSQVAPVLAAAAAADFGKIETTTLPNEIPLHVLNMPNKKKVYLGGLRTFPCIEEEALDQDPGRLLMYERLANWGYDSKGSAIEPRGDKLTRNTELDVRVNCLKITSDGPVNKIENIVAVMNKRMAVSRLNPYVMKWILDGHQDRILGKLTWPKTIAWNWKMKKFYGANSPMANWLRPNKESINNWPISKANKLHSQLCRTGNLHLALVGDVELEEGRELLKNNFGKLRDADPGQFAPEIQKGLTQGGATFNVKGATTALIDFMFPPKVSIAESSLRYIDGLVLSNMVETRLNFALKEAEVDSVKSEVFVLLRGPLAIPSIQVTCKPGDADQVMSLIRLEVERLAIDVPNKDEEVHARLQTMGYLVRVMRSPRSARNFILKSSVFGEVPEDPLDELKNRQYGIVTEQAARYFDFSQCAWSVIADTSLEPIRSIKPVIH